MYIIVYANIQLYQKHLYLGSYIDQRHQATLPLTPTNPFDFSSSVGERKNPIKKLMIANVRIPSRTTWACIED